ncbi:Oidioi.mRNA.OKI2018_I69.chr1.g273.t1.cds [Oikopleura dioica]|uniref:Oidioi.mRNA.OKI2018_I69.chr1.g273.t1.cds n=1 Tax=Oikopleura dioica TaxID=34765 RepID=A0ABN7SJU7_OIKDI|nr:Oidioi.mRNA.OKI2018_I69.chr1.g273.t1.cds [Oikopleura dioica]
MKLFVAIIAASYAQEGSGSPLVPFPIPVGSCFTCNSMTLDECNRNGRVERCMDNEQVCEVEVRSRNGSVREIIMGCKWANACQDNKVQNFAGPDGDREFAEYQCKPWSLNKPSVCRQCCNGDKYCGLKVLREGRNGYGPRTIRGWQENLAESEYLVEV